MLADRDRDKYHDEGMALLAKGAWSPEDADYAIRLHDLLETPHGDPDPVARQLRARLTGELRLLLAISDNPWYRLRMEFFSASQLDSPDPARRRLFLLAYLAIADVMDYENGALGQLDTAIGTFIELDRTVREAGAPAADALGDQYQAALLGLASACFVRYSGRRELLHGDLPADMEREIRADLARSIDAGERAAGTPATRAGAMTILGSALTCRYEDDERYRGRETIDAAVSRLREAVRLAEAAVRESGGTHAARYNLRGIRDKLAGALAVRNSLRDVDEAIGLYLGNQDAAASLGPVWTAGEALSLMTACVRRWMLSREQADRERARDAFAQASAGAATHLPTAFDVATQWGGLAWQEKWWADAGAAYGQATQVLHLMVRQQGSRADREWIVRRAPGAASHAALGLARSGALDDALVAAETGRAVLLSELFDRRTVDYERVASLAGEAIADDYRRLTGELTNLEAVLLLAGPAGDPAAAAAVEQARRRRSALRARMPGAARDALAELEDPPGIDELRRAAGQATVVHLAATGEGGLALILRPDGAPVEFVELEGLTVAAAIELQAGLEYAVHQRDIAVCDEVCERLWSLAMERLLPRLLTSLAGTATEVVVIPGGVLAGLPWHAAKLPGRSACHVLDHLAVSYMPNIRSLPLAREAWRSMPPSPRVLAVEAPEPTSAEPLRTAGEIAAVQACHDAGFRVIWLPGKEATKPRLREALSQFEVIHFAGHARADADPLAGGLLLANDELLTVRELLAGGTGAARLAVLSACETARVEDLVSDEMIGLPTALVQCGFGGVVGSLWAASDRLTPPLMKAFYREWRGNGAAPRQALRVAQQWARDTRRVPALAWANFVYVGP